MSGINPVSGSGGKPPPEKPSEKEDADRKIGEKSKEALGNPPSPRPKKIANLTILTEPVKKREPTAGEIQEALRQIERETHHRFIKAFDHASASADIASLLTETLKKPVTFSDLAQGVTDTTKVNIDGSPTFILKKLSLPAGLFINPYFKQEIAGLENEELKNKLQEILIDKPMDILEHKKPYICAAQREYLAYVIGADLGVPPVQLLMARDGIYSLHAYVENNGTTVHRDILRSNKKIDVQSLQNIVILDLLLENQDRNGGNILVVEASQEEVVFIPIDHALTFQCNTAEDFIRNWTLIGRKPFWVRFSHDLKKPLTRQTLNFIHTLSPEFILDKAQEKIVIENSIIDRLKFNIAKLKEIANGGDTTEQLCNAWLK